MNSECMCIIDSLFQDIFLSIYVKIPREIIQIADLAVFPVSLILARCFPNVFFHVRIPKMALHFLRNSYPQKTVTGPNKGGSWQRTDIIPVVPIAGQKFSLYFHVYLGFFAVYLKYNLSNYSTISCRTSKRIYVDSRTANVHGCELRES